MKYQKTSVTRELKRLKRKMTNPQDRATLDWALVWVKAGLAQTDIEQLERLYRLPDPRD